ncbi:MAG: flagellar biosynthesis protein FlhF, partial [Gammaproteobacteria bacterium]|nr:flagellar biosynthesis protein FlhF [Gammaproteobacteria bacterium]
MKIKRFSAPDMRRAIQLVRQEHGPDAVILSSRSVDGGIEIVSAVDYDPELIAGMADAAAAPANTTRPAPSAPRDDFMPSLETAASTAPPAETPTSASEESARETVAAATQSTPPLRPVIEIDWTSDPSLKAMQAELSTVRGMLNEQFARLSWADLRAFKPERALLLRRVGALSLDDTLAATLVEEVAHPDDTTQGWREVLLGLARRLKVARQDPIEEGGVFALVGPPGVGKTTTIAKMSARNCLSHGPESLALISPD